MDGAADLYASLRLQRTLFAFYFFSQDGGAEPVIPLLIFSMGRNSFEKAGWQLEQSIQMKMFCSFPTFHFAPVAAGDFPSIT